MKDFKEETQEKYWTTSWYFNRMDILWNNSVGFFFNSYQLIQSQQSTDLRTIKTIHVQQYS